MASRGRRTGKTVTCERLAEIYGSGPVVAYVCEPHGDYAVTYMSPGVERLLGWAPRDFLEAPGFWASLVHPDDRERVLAGMKTVSDRGDSHEFRVRHRNGAYRWIRCEVRLERDASGAPREILGQWMDVTGRRRLEEALRRSEEMLNERTLELEDAKERCNRQAARLAEMAEELAVARDDATATDRAKSEFLAMMSHELRTPLNAIIGFSDIIAKATFGPLGNEKYGDYAKDIHQSGRHLLDLVNDVLDLSKIESSTVELSEADVSVPDAIRSVVTLVGDRAEQAGVEIVVDLPRDPPMLRADPRKLKQILLNLMSNAIKFTGSDGRVSLKAWCRQDSGYVFQITDTGIGISLDDIPKALSSFGQVDSKLSRQYEGTGLGLPLAKRLAELHGGSLDLQSAVGVGTTVTVRFPAKRVRPAAKAKAVRKRAG